MLRVVPKEKALAEEVEKKKQENIEITNTAKNAVKLECRVCLKFFIHTTSGIP